jgi:hypothetical protein
LHHPSLERSVYSRGDTNEVQLSPFAAALVSNTFALADTQWPAVASIMIRNGIYLATTRFLDGVEAYNRHVMVLRDGTMRGGGGYYYTVGSYICSGGKWKGEMTSREHSPIDGTYPWARKEISIGFTGTYNDEGADFDATALAGKRSFRFKSIYQLLFAD